MLMQGRLLQLEMQQSESELLTTLQVHNVLHKTLQNVNESKMDDILMLRTFFNR